MYIQFDFTEYQKMNVSVNAYCIFKLMKYLELKKIRPYRQLLSNITGWSPRSITNYFKELKERELIEQRTLYSPQSTIHRKSEEELQELFNEVYNKIC